MIRAWAILTCLAGTGLLAIGLFVPMVEMTPTPLGGTYELRLGMIIAGMAAVALSAVTLHAKRR